MEPISIIATTGTIVKVVSDASLTLYTFISQTKNVDQNVRDLAAEVEGLKRILIEVDSILPHRSHTTNKQQTFPKDGEQLWDTLCGCLEECQVTVVRLDNSLDSIRNKYSNWARQVLRQVKLNLRKDEIDSLRVQIHTHYVTLNTALQLVNIRAAYLAPEVVLDDLGPKIDTLQRSLNLMMASLRDLKDNATGQPKSLVRLRSSNSQKLHTLGSQILRRATTVYGSSVAHSSVVGDPITSETVQRTMDWIPDPINSNENPSSRSSTPSSSRQPLSSTVDASIDTVTTPPDVFPGETDGVESDSEADFEFEVAHGLLHKGKEVFGSADYRTAVGFLQKGVATFARLPYKYRSRLDPVEVPLMIATCKYYLNEVDEASDDLMKLTGKESTSTQDAINKLQVSHLLSQIHLVKSYAGTAEAYCRYALKARRRLLGKTHPDYYASLLLLCEICSDRGNAEEAAIIKDMVPPEFQQTPEIVHLRSLMEDRDLPQTTSGITTKTQFGSHQNTLPSKSKPGRNQDSGTLSDDTHLPLSDTRSASDSSFDPIAKIGSLQRTSIVEDQIIFEPRSHVLKGNFGSVSSVAFSPDESFIASTSVDRTIRVWNCQNLRGVQTLKGHKDRVLEVTFSRNGSFLASASYDGSVRLWNFITGRELRKFDGHTSAVTGVAYSPDGAFLASASEDGTTRVWDVETAHEVQATRGYERGFSAVAFSSDGSLLAMASLDKTIRIWDPTFCREVQSLNGHTGMIRAVAFSPSGLTLASASADRSVRLWDVRTGQVIEELVGHRRGVEGVAFSSTWLASASIDRTVRIWKPETGQEIQRLECSDHLLGVALSSSGSLLAAASRDYTVQLWRAKGHTS